MTGELYNFEVATNSKFTVGIDFYGRQCIVKKTGDNLYQIINIKTKSVIFNDLLWSKIYIEGQPIQKLSDLENIIFNYSCICSDDLDDSYFKIFDESFDNTFE